MYIINCLFHVDLAEGTGKTLIISRLNPWTFRDNEAFDSVETHDHLFTKRDKKIISKGHLQNYLTNVMF